MDARRRVSRRTRERNLLERFTAKTAYRALCKLGPSVRRALRLPLILRVEGYSMTPTLQPGDRLWVDTNTVGMPRPEELVVIRHPTANERILVKRVRSCGRTTFSVGSDDPTAAQDSRHFGPVGPSDFVGRVRFVWPRRRRPAGTSSARRS